MSNPTTEVDAGLVIRSLSAQISEITQARAVAEARAVQLSESFEHLRSEFDAVTIANEGLRDEAKVLREEVESLKAEINHLETRLANEA